MSISKYRIYPSQDTSQTGSNNTYLKQKTQIITGALEYTMLLSKTPIQNTVILYLNGVIVSKNNYTVSNKTIDYTNIGITLEVGDEIEVTYLTED